MRINYQHLGSLKAIVILLILSMGTASVNAQEIGENKDINKPETQVDPIIYWNIKAYRGETDLLDIKAIDEYGKRYDVKGIQDTDDFSILNVKALVNDERIAVKVLVKQPGDKFYPVKAIDKNGKILKIKAIDKNGDVFDVKGFSRSGNIMHLRAISKDFKYYNIIALSPQGRVNAVKGIKMMDEEVETVYRGVKVHAHIKALGHY